MADHAKVEYAVAAGNDYAEHEGTYLNVIKLTKVSTVVILAVVTALGIYGTTGSKFWTFLGVTLALITLVHGLIADTVVSAAGVLVFLLLVWAFLV